MPKFITAKEAAELINDGAWLATSGDGMNGWPNELGDAIRRRFQETGRPRNIGAIHGGGIGDFKIDENGTTGLSLGVDGLLTKCIAGFIGTNPILVKQVLDDESICYMIPEGTLFQLWNEMGRGMPGMLSKVGLGTFVDPRVDGGKCNNKTKAEGEDIVKYIPDFEGEEYLWYKAVPIDFALIGASYADEHGNISCERQTADLSHIALAQACKAAGGKVIVQVEKTVKAGELNPKLIKIPYIYVDYIVVAENPDNIPQNMARRLGKNYEPAFTGEKKIDLSQFAKGEKLPLDEKKVILRRAAQELEDGMTVNMGMGIPQSLGNLLEEEGRNDFTVISETGVSGGIPGVGLDFGCHYNVESMLDIGRHFNYFDAGLLEIGLFGVGEADKDGNINNSHLSGTIKGLGGFANISLNARKTIFLSTFTTGGLKVEIKDGKITIVQEGKINKFIDKCFKVSYVASEALKKGNDNLYITERCVFKYTDKGMTLIEIAPGIDLQKDILDHMGFTPVIPEGGPKLMDQSLFV